MVQIAINSASITMPLILTTVAGLSTVLGSLIFFLIKKFKNSHLVFSLGLSAGAMLYISFVELLGNAINDSGFLIANAIFLAGIGAMMLLDFFIPHKYLNETEGLHPDHASLYPTGIFIALGIAIHNFPEGMAVFISSLSDIHLGTALAVAIAVHNIPEGIAIAIPIYYATRSKSRAFIYSFLSGVAEPLGAIAVILFLGKFVSTLTMAYLFAFVAGIMVFICFDELLPHAIKAQHHKLAITGIVLGMILMIASLSI